MEVNGMGQIANQMLIEAIYKLTGKLKNKKTEKETRKKVKIENSKLIFFVRKGME